MNTQAIGCPRCGGLAMRKVVQEGVEIDICDRCRGVWFDGGEIIKVLKVHEPAHEMFLNWRETLGPQRGVSSYACPRCGVALCAHPLVPDSDVTVTHCYRCSGLLVDATDIEHAQHELSVDAARRETDRDLTDGHWLFQALTALPVEFNVPPTRRPLVVYTLIALNVLTHLALLLTGQLDQAHRAWGMVPEDAWSVGWAVSVFTSAFLHGGLIHLLANMYFLYILGDNVEDLLGRPGFAAFYVACAVAASLLTVLATGGEAAEVPHVGASGAVAGVLGAYVVLFRRARLTIFLLVVQFRVRAVWYVLGWVGYNIAGALLQLFDVAWFAHLGGFLLGAATALALYPSLMAQNPVLRDLNAKPVK